MGMPGPKIIRRFCIGNRCRVCWDEFADVFSHDGDFIATVVDPSAPRDIVERAIAACRGMDQDQEPPKPAKAIVWA